MKNTESHVVSQPFALFLWFEKVPRIFLYFSARLSFVLCLERAMLRFGLVHVFRLVEFDGGRLGEEMDEATPCTVFRGFDDLLAQLLSILLAIRVTLQLSLSLSPRPGALLLTVTDCCYCCWRLMNRKPECS